jgi:hypothetical protein
VIVLVDLHVRGMQRNKQLALSISDAGDGRTAAAARLQSDKGVLARV